MGQIKTKSKMSESPFAWHFEKKNLILFVFGLLIIIVGYIFLSIGPYDSFSSLTIAPILLILGYIVFIPLSIIFIKTDRKS